MSFYWEKYINSGRKEKACDMCGKSIPVGTPHYVVTCPSGYSQTVLHVDKCYDKALAVSDGDAEKLVSWLCRRDDSPTSMEDIRNIVVESIDIVKSCDGTFTRKEVIEEVNDDFAISAAKIDKVLKELLSSGKIANAGKGKVIRKYKIVKL